MKKMRYRFAKVIAARRGLSFVATLYCALNRPSALPVAQLARRLGVVAAIW